MKQKTLQIVVPMAGYGSRFSNAGYLDPKPLIDVNGKPMIQRVIENLSVPMNRKFIFICQRAHWADYRLEEVFAEATNGAYDCIQLDGVTEGAACTVMAAESLINEDDDVLIANSDQIVDIRIADFIEYARSQKLDGCILTFPDNDPKWSYAKVSENALVTEVAEKKVISNHATVGIYYFSNGSKFKAAARAMFDSNFRVNGEFYVCPIYNEMISTGGKIGIWEISGGLMHGLGTPDDLTQYLAKFRTV